MVSSKTFGGVFDENNSSSALRKSGFLVLRAISSPNEQSGAVGKLDTKLDDHTFLSSDDETFVAPRAAPQAKRRPLNSLSESCLLRKRGGGTYLGQELRSRPFLILFTRNLDAPFQRDDAIYP